MKRATLLLAILFTGSLLAGNIFGQESNKKIHLKVIKNGETTVDTSFAAGSLEDDELHKKLSELAGVDINVADGKHKKMVHVDSHGDYSWTSKEGKGDKIVIVKSAKDGENHGAHKTMSAYYTTDDKGNFTIEADSSIIIDGDTISFEKKGNVFIMDGHESTDDWVEKDSGDVKNLKVIVKKVGEDDEDHDVIIIKDGDVIMKGDGNIILEEIDEDDIDKIKIIKVKKGGDGDEKTVNVYVTDEEGDIHTHTSGDVQIFVSDEKGGTEFVSKKVNVVKSKGEGEDEIEITIEVIEDEDVKVKEVTKEKSKKTKQKKEK